MANTPAPAVPWSSRTFGALFARFPNFGLSLARLESIVLREEIESRPISSPVYVVGMARAGTTILLESLAQHPEFASHRYSDYPAIFTPWWWNRLRPLILPRRQEARERAHGDGIAITLDSPEAFEEPLWLAALPWLYRGERDEWLDRGASHPSFERLHRDHLRKLLLARGASRYLAKANPALTRLPYLHRLYPEARFVLIARRPTEHVASLLRQDRRFSEWAIRDRRIAAHLARTGHFEFGPQKRCVRGADLQSYKTVLACWARGEFALGFAHQWRDLYRGALDRILAEPSLREACLLLAFDRLCADPAGTLDAVFAHVGIEGEARDALLSATVQRISQRSAPDEPLSTGESAQVEDMCGEVWSRWCRHAHTDCALP